MEEQTVKGFRVFLREELKVVKLIKSNKGRFLLKTIKLDRDSLRVVIINTFIYESALMALTRMFLGGFLEDAKIGKELNVFQI